LEELCIANADKATEEDNKTLKEKVHQQEAKEKEVRALYSIIQCLSCWN
jgi:hypothetical protein